MSTLHTTLLSIGAAAALIGSTLATAMADDGHWRHGDRGWHGWHRHHAGPPAVVVAPPPAVWGSPPVVYVPPPPPVVYVPPPSGINVILPIHIQ